MTEHTADLRREEIARPLTLEEETTVRHRDAIATDDWLPSSMPLYARTAFDDRRRLLATLDAATARIAALEGALREWTCGSCGGSGRYKNKGEATGFEVVEVTCRFCDGNGLHPTARAVLSGETRTDGERTR